MQAFYAPDAKYADILTLDHFDAKHCVKVLRKKVGDHVQILDGVGGMHDAEIINISNNTCEVKIVASSIYENNHRLHIAIAPTKNIARYEWFLEKACEIGIKEVTPILCKNSERKVVKEERLQKILISAMKQSLRPFLPVLNPLTTFEEVVNDTKHKKQKYIAYCNYENLSYLEEQYANNYGVTILIGPEGDFTEKEINYALNAGFIPTKLGNYRLRTETAGIVACQIINSKNIRE